MTDLVDAAKALRQRRQVIETAVAKASESRAELRARIASRARGGITPAQAARSERKPAKDEGTRAFGAPLGTAEGRKREAQTTDSNNGS